MRSTDEQVRRLRRERAAGRTIEEAAMRSGMHRNTASKHLRSGVLPSEASPERTWRTRTDPFEEDWPQMAAMLEAAPELEAKALFEHLQEQRPGRYDAGQLRTFQRRVKAWRAHSGPEKEIFFQQAHRPGEAAQTDFTFAMELRPAHRDRHRCGREAERSRHQREPLRGRGPLASLPGLTADRGLHGVELITSDDHKGLRAALRARFAGVTWQRCQFYLQQNAQAYVPRKALRRSGSMRRRPGS